MKQFIPHSSRFRLMVHFAAIVFAGFVLAGTSDSATSLAKAIPSGDVTSRSQLSPAVLNLVVNDTGDSADSNVGDGICDTSATPGDQCTLRAAIQETNALAGDDGITFSAGLNNSIITLNNALPDINGNLNITGQGASLLTVQRGTAGGTPEFRIFTITAGKIVALSGLTISNGRVSGTNPTVSGGGISNSGTLTVSDSTVTGNSASGVGGGIENTGTLTVDNSTISNNTGGGISNNLFGGTPTATINSSVISGNTINGGIYNNALNATATVTINNSTISGNTSTGLGGGIFNFSGSFMSRAIATINNSTVSGNIAAGGGGGIGTGAFFGNAATTLTINNSTISGNSDTSAFGGGGIYHVTNGSGSAATLTIINATITANNAGSNGNGGGILIADPPGTTNTLTLRSTIVGGNFRSLGTITSDVSGTVDPSSSFNLIGDNTGMTGVSNGSNGNQIGTSLAPIDPRLGTLSNNGGPTLTHALLVGSPAIDAGNSVLTIDQRGQPRPIDDQTVVNAAGGNASDIGAYEAHTVEVNSTADTDDGLCRAPGTGNGCTLREAINAANAEVGAELITFAPALTSGGPATINLLNALGDLSSDMTIAGSGAALLTVQRSTAGGTPNFSVFHVTGATITIAGLTISNGNLVGILNNQGTLTVSNCIIDGNNEIGIMNGQETNATLIVNDSTISNHTVAGIWNFANLGVIVTTKINNSTISGNGENGILNIASGGSFATLTVNGSTLSGNNSGNGSAGGLDNRASTAGTATATINNSTISGNHSTEFWAGGISVVCSESGSTSSVTLNDSTVSGNFAPPTGNGSGGINVVSFNNGVNAFIHLRNTIVAGNIHATATTFSDISGPVDPASSFNLIGDGSGMTGISNGTNGNQIGTSLARIDPRLGSLANKGGPTQTHALLPGSPALDAGNNALIASPPFIGPPFTDQRGSGFGRIVDGPDADTTDTVDIGAFEAQVSIADIADQTINEDGSLSLPFNVGGVGSITSVTATSSNTTLVPNNPANISISGSGSSRTLHISPVANASGTSTITVTVNGTNSQTMTDTFRLTVSPAGGFIQFSSANFNTTESSGLTAITVERVGNTTQAVTVNYATAEDSSTTVMPCAAANGIASSRCDFTTALGTLRFAAGESSKTFVVLVSQDNYVEGPETLALTLSNPTGGAAFDLPPTATLTIVDDVTEPATNPIDVADSFVRQHYHDFLNREPDPAGLSFWSNQITECQQPGATCSAEVRRINVSAAFFLSIEFQETGYFVYRTYKASYGNMAGTPVPVTLADFLPDTQQIGKGVIIGQPGAEQLLEANKVAYALDFVSRSRFTSAYPTALTPAQFVDALFVKAAVTPSAAERNAAINEFGGAGNTVDTAARARALRWVAENSTLKQQETNKAFVLMQYFGYLRRNPNDPPEAGLNFDGYNFWLGKLNEFNGNFVNAEMVKAFIVSGEYRHRFGP